MPRWPDFTKLLETLRSEGYLLIKGPVKEHEGWQFPYRVEVQCPERHPAYWVLVSNFKAGKRCRICGIKSAADKRRQSLKDVAEIFRQEGYRLQATEFRDSHQTLPVKCPRDHDWEVNLNNFKTGTRCWACSSQAPLDIVSVRHAVEERGFELISTEYINSYTHIDVKCPRGHIRPVLYTLFQQGMGCGGCVDPSRKEIELRQFVKELYPDTPETPIKKLLPSKRLELDIWVPSLRKAIEFDGEYHHGLPGAAERDARKDAECVQVGIKLLRVKYKDYVKNTEAVRQRVLEFLASP